MPHIFPPISPFKGASRSLAKTGQSHTPVPPQKGAADYGKHAFSVIGVDRRALSPIYERSEYTCWLGTPRGGVDLGAERSANHCKSDFREDAKTLVFSLQITANQTANHDLQRANQIATQSLLQIICKS